MSQWYEAIKKPSWAPPEQAFGIAWTVIYALYVAAGVVIASIARRDTVLVALYIAGWALNLLWIPLFRYSTSLWSPLWILGLLVVVVALAWRMHTALRRPWWLLLVPYALWLGFAAALGFSLHALNS
jgi:tryptophan-rich sensory protein